MTRVLEKTERRLGEKLFLKGERCLGPKCATVRRAYPPGAHGSAKGKGGGGRRRRGGGSEFSLMLREKQKVRYIYGLDDKDIRKYNKMAASQAGIFSSNFLRMLESRLDNAVFRLGLADSRRIARQMVVHGHVTVNGKRVTVPSYKVKRGDVLALSERSAALPTYAGLESKMKKRELPKWLELAKSGTSGKVSALPDSDDAAIMADIAKIKEYYSR